MSSVGAIKGNSYNYYGAIASGKRINSASDDPAGMAISEKMTSQGNATSAAADNTKQGISAMNIADGAMAGISDYLQEIKSLSIKAANGLNSKEDKQAIQDQIDQYKQGIMDTVNKATYNEHNLLDGSLSNLNIVSSPDGSGHDVSLGQIALKELGLDNYDVTGDFDMNVVDKAIASVSSKRSQVGASTNGLQAAYDFNMSSLEQVNSANSRLSDLDIPKAVSEQQKQKLLNDFSIQMQKKKEEEERNSVNRLFNV